VEFRCPDGSADVFLLLAGLTVAARHGFEMENALEYAKKTYVDVNIFDAEHKEKVKDLQQLPASCWESAEQLHAQAAIYTACNIFPEGMIKSIEKKLKAYNDKKIRNEISDNQDAVMDLVIKHFHCG